MEAELDNSESSRTDLKNDLELANERMITIEEEIYESKSVQLELLENLK